MFRIVVLIEVNQIAFNFIYYSSLSMSSYVLLELPSFGNLLKLFIQFFCTNRNILLLKNEGQLINVLNQLKLLPMKYQNFILFYPLPYLAHMLMNHQL